MSGSLTESTLEQTTLAWFESLGYRIVHGPDIAPGEPAAERASYTDAILESRTREALARLNPNLPPTARDEALRKLKHPEAPGLIANNRTFQRYLVEGVPVEYPGEGRIVGALARLFDFDAPENNDWRVVNQYTVKDGQHTRRPDLVVFINGLPLAVIELKNPAQAAATVWAAFQQLQTYKAQIPALFVYNALLLISDGLTARLGSLTADRERFVPWRSLDGDTLAPSTLPELEVMVRGVFEPRRCLDLIRYFIVFEDDGAGRLDKKIAAYHQFHAVNAAVAATVQATAQDGDRRAGVVWHTQGSGKSLTMAFYAGKLIQHPALANPTLVILTDRNDLDDQLFGTFARCAALLRQTPAQAQSRADLRDKLQVAAGGVVFTTVQKFFPETQGDHHPLLSGRRNIVVIADEAHRSQYDFIDGYARHLRDALPNATFIGFTGTPIEATDKNTRAVFGDYISIYDIQRAVRDRATVPIYYEPRHAKLALSAAEKPKIDDDFEEVTEGEEIERKEKLKSKWAQQEALAGTPKRLALIADDLVNHFEQRLAAMDGKAMVVCMSRRIAVALYEAIVQRRPDWHSPDDDQGAIKIVMTGSAADDETWQPHIRSKARREALAQRFKNPADPFKLVIVRDMWLTGFDAPCLHTMYLDKPMRGHGLMQAIARVNRVFKDKPGGLVVDYLGLADSLKRAMADYTDSGGQGATAIDQDEAVAALRKHYEICQGLFHGFDMSPWHGGSPGEKLALLPAAQEHILAQDDGKHRLQQAVGDLGKAFALAVPHEAALSIRDEVAFFQAVRVALSKGEGGGSGPQTDYQLDHAIRQIVANAIAPEGVIDLFAAVGLKQPDISILSDEFLAEVRGLPHKNLAVELLRKLLDGEIKQRSRKHLVQSRSFTEMLERAIRAYQNRAVTTAQVIEQLIQLAKDLKAAGARGESLGLNEDETAFYDALETSDSAVMELGDETLKAIARELVETVKRNVSIDWTVKEGVRAKLRVIVKRILRKYGYPPKKQDDAVKTVLEQAELLGMEWVG
ncbi:type I restriction endonuclease subunit R [Methylomagnum ishizawai]|uniref:type I restriction endonuclease subunit R n=1 Tax=Methylomagnum ishizawai TaxID=1760988 RepID=UPI001C32D630|nr:type I restriction endonuclease subunit R [Methylomagnum ishizawai]BBL74215.1 DEAD/DEAH box helicase [Methylomagnum ishizawai]